MREYTFRVVENDTWSFAFTVQDKESGDPIDLTGSTVTGAVKTSYAADTASLTLADGDGITIPDPTNGRVVVAKDLTLSDGNYVYDFQVVSSANVTTTYLRGSMVVEPEVG